ncbi:hypothetical protein PS943_00949 [Pseudomonas fluorescens]|uniref:Uncharacterized protein n=1 Tax=Pseudomonas fluorescens TaxID=294 RepID=A0A5E7W0Z5_PSEFL|nr:hypothetical protein PS943_00949 [Pseudomonas fluorescens]
MSSLAWITQQFDPAAPFEAPGNWLQGRTVFGGLSCRASLSPGPPESDGGPKRKNPPEGGFFGGFRDFESFLWNLVWLHDLDSNKKISICFTVKLC